MTQPDGCNFFWKKKPRRVTEDYKAPSKGDNTMCFALRNVLLYLITDSSVAPTLHHNQKVKKNFREPNMMDCKEHSNLIKLLVKCFREFAALQQILVK